MTRGVKLSAEAERFILDNRDRYSIRYTGRLLGVKIGAVRRVLREAEEEAKQ